MRLYCPPRPQLHTTKASKILKFTVFKEGYILIELSRNSPGLAAISPKIHLNRVS